LIDWTQTVYEIYWYWLAVSFILGAALGSFFNVVIYRLPNPELSIVKPRSFCPSCKTDIAAYDNLPLLSYILLKGKCRHCGIRISPRYFLIELLTGLVALLFFHLSFGGGLFHPAHGLVYCIFTMAMIIITFIDIDLQIIPNSISIPGIPIGLACSLFMPQGFISSLIGAAIGAGFLLAIGYGYYFLTKQVGLGLGDVKLMGMIGAFLGWEAVPFTMFFGSFIGLLYSIPFVIMQGKGRKHKIPFGPFLAGGAITYIFFGKWVMNYLFIPIGG